jgi:CHAD domain-containing protein
VAAGKIAHGRFSRSAAPRSYQLLDGEALSDGVARVASGRFDSALDELRGRTDNGNEKAVHEARKDMKKLRSLLRLVRAELGEEVYARENEAIRDAGRRLSELRDADVMIETLDALADHDPDGLPADVAGGLRQALEANRQAVSQDGAGRRHAQAEALRVLGEARGRVDEWPLEQDGFAAIEAGLKRSYRRGRSAYGVVAKNPSVENLHDWRKRVKDLWYHHKLIECAWPGQLKAYGDEAHRLSDHLGDDHDLAVLRAWAQAHPAAAGGLPELHAFNAAVDRRRGELQRDALALGARIYSEKPGAYMRRLRSYWNADPRPIMSE